MKSAYANNYDFALQMKKTFGLPFVKPEDVAEALAEIRRSTAVTNDLKEDVESYYSYIKKTYVGTPMVNSRYNIAFWNLYQRVKEKIPRTNNAVESWNRRVKVLSECSHQPLYKLIKLLKDEQHTTATAIDAKLSGKLPKLRKHKQIRLDDRLFTLVHNYETLSMADFLKGVALNMISCIKYRSKVRADNIDLSEEEIHEMETQPIVSPAASTSFDRTYSTAPLHQKRRKSQGQQNVKKKQRI